MKDDSAFVIEDDYPTISVGELIKRFYNLSIYKQSELKKEFKGKKIALDPQRLLLSPNGWGKSESLVSDEIYIAVYYQGFFIRIDHGKSLFGPHPIRLFFQVRQGVKMWLATHKHKFMFYDEKQVREKLKQTIRGKEFYCSERSAEQMVELKPTDKKDESIQV